MTKPLGVGVIGLGFMGRTHVEAYAAAHAAGLPNRLVAVADGDAARRAGERTSAGNLGSTGEGRLFDPDATRGYASAEELLADDEVELVSVCTPTDTHVELALRALAAGKHVLVEKPVALAAAEVARLRDAARDALHDAGTLCMPAMCMRFWPGWTWLKRTIDAGTYGPMRTASFRRLGSRPAWSPFYADVARSGGALFDLHVHDVDFAHWCFGAPSSVDARGSLEHVVAEYRYDGRGPELVTAEGGWCREPDEPFVMTYEVRFERATARFELGADPPLTVESGGRVEPVPLEAGDGWHGEVRHLLAAIREGRRELDATLDDAVAVTRTLQAERAALP